MIHDVLEGEGSWDLQLRPDTPVSVTDRLNAAEYGWGQIIITPSPVNIDTIGTQQLDDVCIYSGLLTRQENRTERLSGPGLWAALGRADGVGPLVGAGLSGTNTLRTWIQNLDLDPFITADPAINNTITYTWTSDRVMTYREAIESIMDLTWSGQLHTFIDPRTMTIKHSALGTGMSWHQQRSIAAGITWFFPLLTPMWSGREIGINQPLLRCRFQFAVDNGEWTSDATVTDAGGTSTTAGTQAYTYPGAVDVDMTRYINDGSIPSGSGSTAANAELAANNPPGFELVAFTDERNVLDVVIPGSTVDCWDPANQLWDPASFSPTVIRGQHVWPKRMVVQSVRAPIRAGMGVYYLRFDGGDDAVNLTDWFVPEDGDAQLELSRPVSKQLRNVTRRAGARRQ